jgi:hypothetical protein
MPTTHPPRHPTLCLRPDPVSHPLGLSPPGASPPATRSGRLTRCIGGSTATTTAPCCQRTCRATRAARHARSEETRGGSLAGVGCAERVRWRAPGSGAADAPAKRWGGTLISGVLCQLYHGIKKNGASNTTKRQHQMKHVFLGAPRLIGARMKLWVLGMMPCSQPKIRRCHRKMISRMEGCKIKPQIGMVCQDCNPIV